MTNQTGALYYPLFMDKWQYDRWQYKAAFVVKFRPETDIATGRFEGRVEHLASYEARRFHSLDELLEFIASRLAEDNNPEQR